MTEASLSLALNPDLDVAAHAARFAADGRIHVPDILTGAAAQNLAAALRQNKEWYFAFNDGDAYCETAEADIAAMTPAARTGLWTTMLNRASYDFQYLYRQFAISAAIRRGEAAPAPFVEFFDFANSPAFLDFMKALIGDNDVTCADAFVTRFGPNQFLLDHDDSDDAYDRRAAYVVNLTPDWRADWGGHLLFYDEHGDISGGFRPSYNALNVFKTPRAHAVAYVPPFAGAERYCISGWLRVET